MGRGAIIAIVVLVAVGVCGAAWYLKAPHPTAPAGATAIIGAPAAPAPPATASPDAAASVAPSAAIPPTPDSPAAAGSTLGSSLDPILPKASTDIPFPPECVVPGPPPVMPRGAVASLDDMKIGHAAVQGFVKALEAYQACLESHIASDKATTTPRILQTWRTAGNTAVDASHMLATGYAEQWKIYKARQPAAKP